MLLDAWLASSPARVAVWAGIAGSAEPYICHHLSQGNSSVIFIPIQPYTCRHLGWRQLERYFCVVTSRAAKLSAQGVS